ncbi:MAG: sugar transferase [Kofleriaceae bacterium]|nr:sugar transferase [Kofleriaceae bacterium]MCL4224147.1 sugar transferase [Myxococcales bacterium]
MQRGLKRALDVVGAGVALALAAPVLGATALAIAATMGRPVLFRQRRPGRGGVPFTILKFRTMREVDAAGDEASDAARLTRLGRWLRSTSLDELPELWNVVRGDMSLVGPRPLLEQYLPLYSPEQARRHEVRPGLTGWAQIHGRNALRWEEKFALDTWYVDHWSFTLDLAILARTVAIVLRRQGIAHGGEATMPPFTGTSSPPMPASPMPASR